MNFKIDTTKQIIPIKITTYDKSGLILTIVGIINTPKRLITICKIVLLHNELNSIYNKANGIPNINAYIP